MDTYQNISPRDEKSLFFERCIFAPRTVKLRHVQFNANLGTLFFEMFDDLVLITNHSLVDSSKETWMLVRYNR